MIQKNEFFQDWLFRYQYIYRMRRTDKEKQRFLKSIVTDISQIREDLQVIEYNKYKKGASRNVYVGDIQKADQIICTYYDTPPATLQDYPLFKREEQKKQVTTFILLTSLCLILVGGMGLFVTQNYLSKGINWNSPLTIALIASYALYFLILSKVSKGISSRRTLVRNTSSLLTLLTLMDKLRGTKTAFALLDEGCFGESGLNELINNSKKTNQIFYLDGIGSDLALQAIGPNFEKKQLAASDISLISSEGKINYLFSGQERKDEKMTYIIEKSSLKSKQLNMDNLEKVINYFK